jgi:uncharacterized protein (DUF3084 family)
MRVIKRSTNHKFSLLTELDQLDAAVARMRVQRDAAREDAAHAENERRTLRGELDNAREDRFWAEHHLAAEEEHREQLEARLREAQCILTDPQQPGPVDVPGDWLDAAQDDSGSAREIA